MTRWTWILFSLVCAHVPCLSQESTTSTDQSSPFSQAKFVPDISLILDCSYLHRSLSDEEYAGLFVPGYAVSDDHGASHEGFNLNYAEITFYSIVDPYFELLAVCHLSEDHFHLEEAYWVTRKFPPGLQLKAGKFLSSFGRINEQHAHYRDFADPPLMCAGVFGAEGLNEIGARLTWVLPWETYVLLGGEGLMGSNESSFGRAGIHAAQGPVDVSSVNGPGVFVGYGKTAVDIGDASVLVGLSGAWGTTRVDQGFSAGEEGGQALAGHTTVYGGDLTVKYIIDAVRYVAVQSEVLFRSTVGTLYGGTTPQSGEGSPFDRRQSGVYVQAVAKVGLQWRAGMRYDVLLQNEVLEDGVASPLPENLQRWSAMLEFNPTEFSRLRLQYNYDCSKYSATCCPEVRSRIHELNLQVNLAIGAHGAHGF